jgi:DNA invertase Pin-like site-specific DNA recombinase
MGEMSTTLQSLLASFERRRASERTRDALRRRAEAGAATGGPPYGYATMRNGDGYSHYVINPIEAGIVREIFQWFDEGAGVMRIAKRLNEQGVAAPRGGRKGWAPVSVSQLLRRPITRAADAGGVVTTGAVPTTIVDWSAAAMGSECWLTRWTGACSMLSPRRSPRKR